MYCTILGSNDVSTFLEEQSYPLFNLEIFNFKFHSKNLLNNIANKMQISSQLSSFATIKLFYLNQTLQVYEPCIEALSPKIECNIDKSNLNITLDCINQILANFSTVIFDKTLKLFKEIELAVIQAIKPSKSSNSPLFFSKKINSHMMKNETGYYLKYIICIINSFN